MAQKKKRMSPSAQYHTGKINRKQYEQKMKKKR